MNLETICNGIEKVISMVRVPAAYIPATTLVCSATQRPGLSAILIASRIIQRQVEAGIPAGAAADGGRNLSEAMEAIRVEEIVRALKMDANIQVGLPIGTLQFLGNGANAGGPVQITGTNINAGHSVGIIQ